MERARHTPICSPPNDLPYSSLSGGFVSPAFSGRFFLFFQAAQAPYERLENIAIFLESYVTAEAFLPHVSRGKHDLL
jgi:hypothetical protein